MTRLLAVMCALCTCSIVHYVSAQESTTYPFQSNAHWYRIDQPVVTEAEEPLGILVYPNDRVWFRAGGCVQTGGHGDTWKRYVNPSGDNADRIYHGRIRIPGAIDTLTDLSFFLNGDSPDTWRGPLTVSAPAGPPISNQPPQRIELGYSDDGYGDNGYYSHDNGNNDQCLGVGPAWIEFFICRADPVHGPTC